MPQLHYGKYAMSQAEPVVVPKGIRFESETYRRLISIMSCALCNLAGPSQAAHANMLGGKGMARKSDDRYTVPLCPPCHSRLDQPSPSEARSKDERRRAEATLVLQTIDRVINGGVWPASVPRLDQSRIEELERWAS